MPLEFCHCVVEHTHVHTNTNRYTCVNAFMHMPTHTQYDCQPLYTEKISIRYETIHLPVWWLTTTNVIHCDLGVGVFTESDLCLWRMTKCNVKMRKEKHRYHIIGINIFRINISSQGNGQWRKWLIEKVWQVQPFIPVCELQTDDQTLVTFLHKSPYSMPLLHMSLSALLKVVRHYVLFCQILTLLIMSCHVCCDVMSRLFSCHIFSLLLFLLPQISSIV